MEPSITTTPSHFVDDSPYVPLSKHGGCIVHSHQFPRWTEVLLTVKHMQTDGKIFIRIHKSATMGAWVGWWHGKVLFFRVGCGVSRCPNIWDLKHHRGRPRLFLVGHVFFSRFGIIFMADNGSTIWYCTHFGATCHHAQILSNNFSGRFSCSESWQDPTILASSKFFGGILLKTPQIYWKWT